MTGRRGDRAAFRAFARAHHPGVGGDPAVFAAGLARFREPESRAEVPVTFVARHRGTAARSSRTAARAHGRGVSAVSARRRVALFARHRPAAPFTRRRRVAMPLRRRGSAAFLSRFRRRPPRVR
ncbi:hypothetical protein [Amycolatopsis sp. DG1A-15b]|uniref:hypothetical protein n=1 Tax=Amycolatopsis sp. DG1A-15b TaxID=3052846 RepID=UPI00255B765B|nr:hypothetical protein [Amycolatopsis sp. DG1A-15b]WIX89416.1 hypothetical protein QRY02_02895 [Amycolatopsis sp. DG1A-15b]